MKETKGQMGTSQMMRSEQMYRKNVGLIREYIDIRG